MDTLLSGALILIVDDTEYNLDMLEAIFSNENADTLRALNGEDALKIIEKRGSEIDLMILDIRMPGISGIELAKKIREVPEWRQIPIILLTAETRTDELVVKGLDAGANDYLEKPVNQVELLARSQSMLRQKRLVDANMELQRSLELKVVERTLEIEQTRDAAMFGFAKLAEHRDPETGAHLERIREYSKELATHLSKLGRYGEIIDPKFILTIYKASPLHDIGKVGIKDNILLKPGKLTKEEFEEMKKHAAIGGVTLQTAEERLTSEGNSFLTMAKEIAFCHHEKWDGTGYPEGTKGEAIPLSARIMTVCDVYDALVSKRVYKEAWPHEKTCETIMDSKGSHFDPDIADAFGKIADSFKKIKTRFED